MISLPLPPKVIQKKKNQAVFEIEALYPGYGVTIGNSLRRVLLASLQGSAVTELKIKGVPHEFSTIPGVLEDVIMVMLNVKNLRFKMFEGEEYVIELNKKGEGEVTGADFKIPPQVKLVNPEIHLATITDKKTELHMTVTIKKGIGYVPKEQLKNKKLEIGTIALDAIFTPIRNVNFQVESMRVGDRTDFDRLSLEIETDGTITPEEAFFEASDILIKHFNVIFQGKVENTEEKKSVSAAKAKGKNEDVASMMVEELKFTGRTLNALLKNNIKTIGAIVKISEKDLTELEGMGEKGISEIKRKLKKLGQELKAE